MGYADFLNAVIDDGMEAARVSYGTQQDRSKCDPVKLEGSLAGFELCRGLKPHAIASLLADMSEETAAARTRHDPRYWFWRCRESEVQWVANVMSAALVRAGLPFIVNPTYRGLRRALDVLELLPDDEDEG